MNIELTTKEFRRLLDMVYIGNWVLNSTRGEDRFSDYDDIQEKMFAQCAKQDDTSIEASIREGSFPYPCGDNHGCGVPEGSWRYQWSHLPRYIKQYFYDTFQKGGRFYEADRRLPVSTWLSIFRRYQELLATGALQEKDAQSGKIYPNRMKERGSQPRRVSQYRVCRVCGETFDLSEQEENYFRLKGFYLPQTCPRCRQLKRVLAESINDGLAV